MDLWETLNSAYEPLYRRAQALCSRLNAAGYGCQWNWYAFHFSRRPEGFSPEFFPIPVITVQGLCDTGLELDWSAIRRPFEVYGADDYCGDLYRPGMTPDQLRARIAQDGAKEVGVQLTLAAGCTDEEVLTAVAECRGWGPRP